MALLLTHLGWAVSGVTCDDAAMTSHSASMADMDMPAGMADMDMGGPSQGPSGGESEHSHQPCELPSVPGGCQSMAPCAVVALASITAQLRTPDGMTTLIPNGSGLIPPYTKLPPELPPPRA